MTVNATTTISAPQAADGSNRNWYFPFKIVEKNQIVLYLLDANALETRVTSGYTVVGVGSDNGGEVTYPLAPIKPLPLGVTVKVGRLVAYEQPDRLGNQGPYFPRIHEGALDRLEMQIQQLAENVSRSPLYPIFTPPPSTVTFPPPDPGHVLIWDESGNLTNSATDVAAFETSAINAQAAAEIAMAMAASASDAAAAAAGAAGAAVAVNAISYFDSRTAAAEVASLSGIADNVNIIRVASGAAADDGLQRQYVRALASAGPDWFPDLDGSFWVWAPEKTVIPLGFAARSKEDRWRELPHVEDWRGYGGDPSDTGALQNAINLAGGKPLRLPALLTIQDQIEVATTGTSLIGTGWGTVNAVAGGPNEAICQIQWGGGTPAAGTAMLWVKSAAASEYVWDFFIDRVYIGGGNAAPVGLRLSSTRTAHIGRLYVERCTENAVLLDDANGLLHFATKIDELYIAAGSSPACLNMNGLNMRQQPGTGTVGCTWLHGNFVSINTQSGDGAIFGNVDNCHFAKLSAGSSGGKGVRFRGLSDSQTQVSRKNFIAQYSGHQIYAETKSRNAVDWINSEGTSVTIEPGGVLHYKVLDREDGRRWSTFVYDVNPEFPLPASNGYVVTGTPVLTTVGTLKFQSVNFDAAVTETWGWTLGPRRNNSGGRIVGFKGTGCKSVATNAGNVRLQIGVKSTSTTQGLGAALVTKAVTHTVDAAAAQTFEEFTITLDTPVDYHFNGHMLVHLSRLGADAADTFPDDWCLLSLAVLTEANVGSGDPPDYRYGIPADVGALTGAY